MYLCKEGQFLDREDVEKFIKEYTERGYSFPLEQNFSIDITVNQHQEEDNILHTIQHKTLDYLFYRVFNNYMKIKKLNCHLKYNTEEKEYIEVNISLI